MGCNCKATKKGQPNKSGEKWLAIKIYDQYKESINTKTIEEFTDEDRRQVRYWYYEIYNNSVEVDYVTANKNLVNVFRHHKLI